ncbi:MAG: hypothetical protein JNL70_11680 [Saprospiraceae bacterium]|nr:hypothetical protein [Saprospiraceae bacterium]
MKKDIPELKVEEMALAVVPPAYGDDELWECYLFNFKEEPIRNVMVVSKGYGEDEQGEKRRTSTLRHFFEEIAPMDMVQVEPVPKSLFWLSHEYWVSFSFDGQLYDKKYVFVVGAMDTANFTMIPFLDRKGVMIR